MNNLKNPLKLYQQGTGNGNCNLYMTIDEPYDKKDGEYVSKEVAEEMLAALIAVNGAQAWIEDVEVKKQFAKVAEAIKNATE